MRVDTNTRTFLNGGTAIERGRRVKLSSGVLALAALGDGDVELGVTETRIEANGYGAVRLRSAAGTREVQAAVEIAVGDSTYSAADGKVSDVAATGATKRGIALTAASGDGAIFEELAI